MATQAKRVHRLKITLRQVKPPVWRRIEVPSNMRLSELAAVMQTLGPDASRVQVLFVTVDPERDTAALLAQYVPAFNPTFLGLRGDADATAAVAKEFKVLYQKQPGTTPGSYSMDHSAGTFVFDPQGRLRVYVSYGQGPQVFAHDIAALLHASS